MIDLLCCTSKIRLKFWTGANVYHGASEVLAEPKSPTNTTFQRIGVAMGLQMLNFAAKKWRPIFDVKPQRKTKILGRYLKFMLDRRVSYSHVGIKLASNGHSTSTLERSRKSKFRRNKLILKSFLLYHVNTIQKQYMTNQALGDATMGKWMKHGWKITPFKSLWRKT